MGGSSVWLIPQNLKFRKYTKRFVYGRGLTERRVNRLRFGSCCGLLAIEGGCLTPKQLQTAIAVINKTMKVQRTKKNVLECSVVIRAPVTKKPLGSRMGRGKGGVDSWVVAIRKGRVLFQLYGQQLTRRMFLALKRVRHKLPFLTRMVTEPYARIRQMDTRR
jgi:large subunit ribosomal protein L16